MKGISIMNHRHRVSHAIIGAAALASVPFAATAQPAATHAKHTLSVSGEGEVRAVPDQAQLSAGVVTQAKTAEAALSANAKAMNGVFASLRKAGIPEKSIQTSNFSISPQYPPYRQNAEAENERKIIGYEVSNQVTVILDDVSKVGATLDALVASGANSAGGVSFAIRNPTPLMMQARSEAVKDAIAKAQTLAKAAGVSLGPILSISEGGDIRPVPMYEKAMSVRMAAPAPTPVAAGEQSVTAHVAITWEIQ
jgi:uncharacterized protein YggE